MTSKSLLTKKPIPCCLIQSALVLRKTPSVLRHFFHHNDKKEPFIPNPNIVSYTLGIIVHSYVKHSLDLVLTIAS